MEDMNSTTGKGSGEHGCKIGPYRCGLGDIRHHPDNDICIPPNLLKELSFIPPTAIDLQFHGGVRQRLESRTRPIASSSSALSLAAGSLKEKIPHCLTGRAVKRRHPTESSYGFPSQSPSVLTFPGYAMPEHSILSVSTIHGSQMEHSFPRLPREGRKPLQR